MARLTNMTKQNKAMTLLSGITGIALETHAVMLEILLLRMLMIKVKCVTLKKKYIYI